jgi:hypothetical protein
LKVTRARVQPHLANLGSGGATLRFGRVWTGAMFVQVALTAIGIPGAMETAREAARTVNIRAAFPSRAYLAAYIDVDRPFETESTAAFEERRAQTLTALDRRLEQEPGVAAVAFADRAPGSIPRSRQATIEPSSGAGRAYDDGPRISAVGPGFFEAFDRPIVAGRGFHGGDWTPAARTVIVNEAFARAFSREAGGGSPIGARIRYRAPADADEDEDAPRGAPPTDTPFEIVGVVRDFGLDPDDLGDELPYVFHAAPLGTASPLVIIVRANGTPDALVPRLPVIAAEVDATLFVRDAQPLDTWIRERDESLTMFAAALAAVTMLVLFLSALGIFSLVSVGVSRRTREIGLRTALGASPRQVLAGILSRAVVLMASGIAAGGALLLWFVAFDGGPAGRAGEDLALYAGYLGVAAVVMLGACLLACIAPARRALRISPTEALREA